MYIQWPALTAYSWRTGVGAAGLVLPGARGGVAVAGTTVAAAGATVAAGFGVAAWTAGCAG
jgi:hypothetical protein